MVLFRAACVAGFCLAVGWIVWRRTANFWLAIGAVFAASTVARGIAVDRPFVVTYLLLAGTMLILERRRPLWVLPLLFVLWANVHGGYFVGWIVLGAYCAEALLARLRGKPPADERALWMASIASIAASALNPAAYGVIPGMFAYRQSFLQNTLREWHSPALWPLSWFTALLAASIVMLAMGWRRVRVADWLLFGVFTVLALMARRNIVFIALIAPIVIASYLPKFKRALPRAAEYAFAAVIVLIAGERVASGHAFQLRATLWKFPDGAVQFLKRHNVSAPMFNLYEWGGYLMWAAWPQEKTFVDGRALNESVFRDYLKIALNTRSAQELLDRYGVQVLLLQGFEYGNGTVYFLGASLSDPAQTRWKLVYQDNTAMVFMRNPPPGVHPLPPGEVLTSLEAQCRNQIEHQPSVPRCARGLGDLYARLNLLDRSRQWIESYRSLNGSLDPEIDRLYEQIRSGAFHVPAR
jgi:hypothetical protein